jgi:hypothetical protein
LFSPVKTSEGSDLSATPTSHCMLTQPFRNPSSPGHPQGFFVPLFDSINPIAILDFPRILLWILIERLRDKLVFRIFQRTDPHNEACIFKVTFETYFPPKPPEDLNGSTTISQVKVSTKEGVNGSLEETVTFLV